MPLLTAMIFSEITVTLADEANPVWMQVVIGVNPNISNSLSKLKSLLIENDGKIIGKVLKDEEIVALTVELSSKTLPSLSSRMKAEGWASYVESRTQAELLFIPNDTNWTDQWAPEKIEADWAWNITEGNSDVLVAVIDSGIEWNHSDLAINYEAGGYDWVNNDTDPMDTWGHGTHVAGIIAAILNNSVGIAGLAQVKVMAEKVFENYTHGGYIDQLANGIINATDCGADIISMSFRIFNHSDVLYDAIKYAADNNVILVGGAGNEGFNAKCYPAAYDEVIAVSATSQSDNIASFSNYGDWIDFSAPGVGIISTYTNDSYKVWDGTSFSTPHVSGLAALILSRYPRLQKNDSVRYWIQHTSEDLGEKGFDPYYGYGRINAYGAVNSTDSDYDLVAIDLDVPSLVEANASREVRGLILNFGTINQSNVEVHLVENGSISVANTTIDSLLSGASEEVNFSWTPDLGVYNLTLAVKPETDDVWSNNNISKNVATKFPSVLNVPSEFQSIQAALNEIIPKDTINVSSGTYIESIYIDMPDIRLIGNGSKTTIIQANNTGSPYSWALNIAANNVTVSGFKIVGFQKATIELNSQSDVDLSFNNISGGHYGIRLVGSYANIITRNNITGKFYGIEMRYSWNNDVFHNTFYNGSSGMGMRLRVSFDNKILLNNFNSTAESHHVLSYTSQNTWDDGYPDGGNFWACYDISDDYSGPYQNESGSDDIGDSPYLINDTMGDENYDDQDRYPFMAPIVHDVAIIDLVSNETHVTPGEIVKISVMVENQGNFNESFTVSVNAYNITEEINYNLGSQNITSLIPLSNETLIFNWNTTDATQNVTYTIKAETNIVSNETDTTDNTYVDGTVFIRSYNNPPQTPLTPDGLTPVYPGQSYNYTSTTSDPDEDQVYYEFDWDDDTTTEIGPYPSNETGHYASHAWFIPGTYNVTVRARDKFYNYSDRSDSLQVTVNNQPSGCPFVYVWNGTEFVIDNNLLTGSAKSNGTEVEDYYRLEQDLVPLYEGFFNSYYSLQISEFQQEHSYFDHVQLFAIDHDANVSVAVSPTGEFLTYQSPYPPITAVDENNASWLEELSDVDGEYYEGYNGSYVILNFGEVNSSDAKLILVADPPPPTKKSIIIQVLNSSESWVDVVSIIPRAYWATDIIDLSEYLPSDGALVVRLYFTDNHRVDFVGLDTTPQAEIDVEDAHLLWAYHSEEGTVTEKLQSDNNVYAELVPDQQITLLFRAPNPDAEARTFIFYVKGYYYTITS